MEHVFSDITRMIPVVHRELLYGVFWRAQEDFLAMQKEDSSPALLGHLGEKMLFDMVELLKSILSSSALAATHYCHRCESQCRIHGPASLEACTTTLAIAGTLCTPWSSIGSRKKWMHHTCISFAVWVHLMLVRLPDIVIHECTPGFDVSVLVAFFGAYYCIQSVVFCPLQLGVPARRKRRFTVMISRRKFRASPQFLPDGFANLFFRRRLLHGQVFFCLSDDF